jgi:hypothetical protein
MPLYKINEVDKVTQSYQIKRETEEPSMQHNLLTSLLQRIIDFYVNNGEKDPNIYMSPKSLDMLSRMAGQSLIWFGVTEDNSLGEYFGRKIYICHDLIEYEYFLSFTEKEVKSYKRKSKLKTITKKLNATI